MKKTLCLLAILTVSLSAQAEYSGLPNDVSNILAAIQKYSRASSILLWCSETHSLHQDGSQIYEWHSFRYIPDEAARDAYGDPRVNYIEGKQTVEILRACTFTKDGRQIDCTPENAYNPVVPDGLDLAPEFGDYRQLVVTLLGLENGSISEFHYRVTTPDPLLPWLEGRVYFREDIPVIARELTVEIPSGQTLTHKTEHGAPTPIVNGSRHVWKVGEQAGYVAEDLAGHRVLLPNVAFTSAKDWAEVCNHLSEQINAAGNTPVELPESLSEELAGKYSAEARLNAIRSWVNERFHKLAFDHPDFSLSLRTAHDVLNAGYGNGFELAVLVKTLAAANNLKMDFAPRFLPESPVPSLHEWADPVLIVHSDLGTTYLTDALASKSETYLELDASTIFDLSTCKEREPSARMGGDPRFNLWLTLDNLGRDSIKGHGSLIAVGNWGVVESIQENGATSYLNSLVTLPGFECSETQILELTDRGRLSLAFEFACGKLESASEFHMLPVAALDFSSFVNGAPWSLPTREFAQELPIIGKVHLVLDAKIPDKWSVSRRPPNSSATWDWSKGDVTCEMNGDRVIYERTLDLSHEWLAASAWSGFRNWIIESGLRPNNIIVFEPKKESKSK